MLEKKIITVKNLPKKVKRNSIFYIDQNKTNNFTHGIYKYPCKFIPEIPKWCIEQYLNNKSSSIILDPFMGSGTTLLEANLHNLFAYGAEIDNISKLIAKVKTTKIAKNKLSSLDNIFNYIIKNKKENYINFIPKIENIYHWFPKDNVKRLAEIKANIYNLEDKNLRDIFYLCLISIIKRVSFADSSSPKPYVSNRIVKVPKNVDIEFEKVYINIKNALNELNSINKFGKSYILKGDAINFKINKKIDLAITSPPYINAFDYVRMLRLENMWYSNYSEEELKKERKNQIGTEFVDFINEKNNLKVLELSKALKISFKKIYSVDGKKAIIVKKYYDKMHLNLLNVYKHLNENGKYIIIIGNNKIKNIEIENWKILKEIATSIGYTYVNNFSYIIRNPYLNISRGNKGGKINLDNVLILEKKNGTKK